MIRRTCKAVLALTVSMGWTPLAAQEPSPTPADSAAETEPAPTFLETALPGVKISGYAEASFTASTADARDADGREVIVGRSYERFDDDFMLNALKLALEKPVQSDQFSAGFRADLLVGQNATLLQSAGLNLGDQGDVEQAYVMLNIPTGDEGRALTFKAGKQVSLMGVEVIEDVANPVWSEGNQFLFGENFTATGLEVAYRWSPVVITQLLVFNGWDVVKDNNDDVSFMGRLGITPDDRTTIALLGFIGPEQAGNDDADRKGVELLVYRAVTDEVKLWGQVDYGTEDASEALPVPTNDAEWFAAALWATVDFTPEVGIGLRADYFNDMDGARTSNSPFTAPFPANTGQEVGNGTLTLNIRAWENALIRPEVRYDKSSLDDAFGVDDDGEGRDDQFTFSLSAAFLY
jgi:hypothetical protein